MYTKQDLISHLSNIGINPNGTLKVHVSYKAIGDVYGCGETVLDALMEYMSPGLLVLPSHTWSYVHENNPVMDVLHTKSCVGILTEIFRKKEGVHRSLHPTHSVAAFGADAQSFVAGEEKIHTPCGEGGVYYKLWERDAQILLIGVNFELNTFIHGIEEWDGAVGVVKDTQEDYHVINYEGHRLYSPQRRHCAPLGSAVFCKLEPQAMQEEVLTLGKFGDATARLMRAKALRAMVAPLLEENPRYLLTY